jgi:hypothetical protein
MIASFVAALPFGIIMFVLGYGNVNYISGAPFTITTIGTLVAFLELMFYVPILVGAKG